MRGRVNGSFFVAEAAAGVTGKMGLNFGEDGQRDLLRRFRADVQAHRIVNPRQDGRFGRGKSFLTQFLHHFSGARARAHQTEVTQRDVKQNF